MKRPLIVALVLAVGSLLALFVFTDGDRSPGKAADPTALTALAMTSSTAAERDSPEGDLYGRATTIDGATYLGQLRFGGDEEAFWGHYFNGTKDENPWIDHVPTENLTETRPLEIFGVELGQRERQINLERPFMARFGDIARIYARGKEVRVTLKSGTEFDLDRLEASDLDDGLRIWDTERGVVDLGSRQIRSIEFLPPARPAAASLPLHGTVHTHQGAFSGFLQWNRQECVGSDLLDGHSADGELSLRFDTIRAIARHSSDSSLVSVLDGREVVISETREAGQGNLGVYVDDQRYGRVLISWDAFERVEFSPGGSGPAYDDFPPGRPLSGSVSTRAGRRLTGRLVFDLDESETTETLDAPSQGVDYTIPFGLIASIDPSVGVILHSGEPVRLEPTGDLGKGNAGMLIFVDGLEHPEYVPWADVARVDLDRPLSL